MENAATSAKGVRAYETNPSTAKVNTPSHQVYDKPQTTSKGRYIGIGLVLVLALLLFFILT